MVYQGNTNEIVMWEKVMGGGGGGSLFILKLYCIVR